MSGEVDLASKLHTWAVKEMHFYSQGASTSSKIPTVEDFKMLCKGPNAAIWKWVIAHVYSTETVRTVKGNLALKAKTSSQSYRVKYGEKESQYEQTKHDLLAKRASLSGEITTTLRDIGHLEHEIDRITTDISETGTGSYMKTLEREEYYSRETADQDPDSDSDTPALETASCKHVRECCEEIGGFLQDTLKGAFSGDKSQFAKRKEPLWQKVELVSGTFSADQILTSLLHNTRDTTATLKAMTSKVDIRRDAQNLRFKYEPGGDVKDLAKPPSLLRSVHQLLQERTNEHLQRFIQSQKYTNEARNLEESIVALKGQIEKRLQKLFSQKNADFALARNLIEAELELDGYRASLHCLNREGESLKEIVESSFRERQELITKYHRIQEFQELTDKKQNVIQVLVKQNLNSQSRLDSQIDEIDEYIERSLMSHQTQISTVSGKLQDCITLEVNEFANLALPYLMFSQIENALKTAVLDLSIHQTSPANLKPALMTVLQCLNFQSFQAPEMVLRQCLQIKTDIEEIVYRLDRENWQQQWRTNKQGEKDIVSVITDLCETMKVEDEKQMKKTQPMLQQQINKTANALSNCLQAKSAATAWWEQPGQSCVPWITVDGQNLQYYVDQWKVLVTNLRQLLLKK
ncbi:HAUS augmin-like complex subunit 5 [Ruditapes philippinarum]|uniref:HAUS augmin-like complex subunit 5 n=1 Tax=Ruditapes philippinarum TaxID=129788 RepID=UPI00295A7944|nr:HAUS augmin-like complex subunit 5 [Ruditapes philippinarum]